MKKKRSIFLCLLATIMAIAYSCRDEYWMDMIPSSPNPTDAFDVSFARDLFEKDGKILALPKLGMEPESPKDSFATVATRMQLPDLKKSNIVLNWQKAFEWSDDRASYIEIPLSVGAKLLVVRTWKNVGDSIKHEHVYAECRLVFEQNLKSNEVQYYVVTLIGTKEYLKKKGGNIQKLHHKPDDNYTGLVYYSSLTGRVNRAYHYTNGKVSHKLFLKKVDDVINVDSLNIQSLSLVDISQTTRSYSSSSEFEPYYCVFCNHVHFSEGESCVVEITYCSECHSPIESCCCCYYCHRPDCICECFTCGFYPCRCCPICREYPCICRCVVCGYYPCICNENKCENCGQDPCQCCPSCYGYPCVCCPNCHTYPCVCCSVCHKNPCICEEDNCPGPICSVCGGTMSSARSANCPICNCGNELCEEIELFLENPGLYSVMTRSTVVPGPRPGPDYIFRVDQWVHINDIKNYNGIGYRTTVEKHVLSHVEMCDYLIERRDAFSLPVSGLLAVGVGLISDNLFKKMTVYLGAVGGKALACIGALFQAKSGLVKDYYQESLDEYNRNSPQQGGIVIVTQSTDANGDLPITYTSVEIYNDNGFLINRFLY